MKKIPFKRSISVLSLVFLASNSFAQQKVDILIKNAYVFNGDGKDSVLTNVGITNKRISFIGNSAIKAKEVIDAKGKYLTPGFIDPHTHAGGMIENKRDNGLIPWLTQGVTTVFMGSDGGGRFEIAKKSESYDKIGVGTNYVFFVGFGPVRSEILAKKNVKPTPEQVERMKLLVGQGMQEGAIGFSTGLIYLPQMYSKTKEVKELYAQAAKYNAVYDTHMRNESNKVLESIDEVLEIGDRTKLPLHISHIKVSGDDNWGRSGEVIEKINQARERGINLTANQYPFVASMTSLKATVMPAWAQEGGAKSTLNRFGNPEDLVRIKEFLNKRSDERYKRIVIMSRGKSSDAFRGKSIHQISQELGLSCADAAIEILKQTNMGASVVNFGMSEEDVIAFMKQPWVMTGSDGGGLHPRTYATFTKIIEDYVVKQKVISMTWAIRRATGLTADTFNLKDRGYIKEGYFADLVLFDPQNIKALSTFTDPEQLSVGMDYVFVNGQMAIENGKITRKLAGQIIKNTNYVQNK